MAPYVTAKVLPILKDTTTCWQPADYLPKPESDTFLDEVRVASPGTHSVQGQRVCLRIGIDQGESCMLTAFRHAIRSPVFFEAWATLCHTHPPLGSVVSVELRMQS